MRAIVFLLFVVLVFLIVRFTLNRIIEIREKNREQLQKNTQQPSSIKAAQEMVRCAECGVHLPQSEAYFDGKDTFCSEGHMQRFHEKSRQQHNGDFQAEREQESSGDSKD